MTRCVGAQEASSGEDDDMPLAQLIGLRAAVRPAAPCTGGLTHSGAPGPALQQADAETPPAQLFSSSPPCGVAEGPASQQPDEEWPPAALCASSPACGDIGGPAALQPDGERPAAALRASSPACDGTGGPAVQLPTAGQPPVPPAGSPARGRNVPALELAAARRGSPAASPGALGCEAPQAPRSERAAAPAAGGESGEPAELLIPDSQSSQEAA